MNTNDLTSPPTQMMTVRIIPKHKNNRQFTDLYTVEIDHGNVIEHITSFVSHVAALQFAAQLAARSGVTHYEDR